MKNRKPLKEDGRWPTFDQVRGYDVEVKRLKAVANALRNSGDFEVFPKGIMFSGYPGTGKTTLAKAFIRATGFPCFSPDQCPDAESLSATYDAAAKQVPSIVFLDDVDRIVSTTGSDGYVSDDSRSALKELLDRLDGLESSYGVITVMTTNEYFNLDDAMKRSGRVDLHIPIDRPNDQERKEILLYYMDKHPEFFPSDGGKLAASVAEKCHGMTCSDLKLVVKDVYLLNYGHSDGFGPADFADAFQSRIMELNGGGLLKRDCKNENDVRRICIHEAGHAILDWALLGKASDVCCLQTSDGGGTAGWTEPRESDDEEKFFVYEDLINEIAICLGGMAAEEIGLGNRSQGSSSDLEKAESLAKMLLIGCFDGDFSYLPCLLPSASPFQDDDLQTEEYLAKVQKREHEIIELSYDKAKKCLTDNRRGLDELSAVLFDKGILSAEKVTEILSGIVPRGKKRSEKGEAK